MQSRFSSLEQWLQWQETLHVKKIDLSLERVRIVARHLGLQSIAKKVITVAGTNGKGSTVAFLEQLYLASGYSVASYTSPHLLHYNERITIQGKPISDESLLEAFAAIDAAREDRSLTYFEFGTLAAFYIFAKFELDIALLEVGMGGRLDATNIIDADIALITSIGLDHQAWLGSTREEIGYEKAGIFRANKPAICGDRLPPESVLRAARERGAHLYRIGADFDFTLASDNWQWQNKHHSIQKLPLPVNNAVIQLNNISTALQAASLLRETFAFEYPAVLYAIDNYRLPGRCQLMQRTPEVWFDVAHNPQAISALVEFLSAQPGKATHLVLGFLADKEVEEMVRLLEPGAASWHLAAPNNERSLAAEKLAAIVARHSREPVSQYGSVGDAFQNAVALANESDRIVVAGSFFTVSEAMAVKRGKRL